MIKHSLPETTNKNEAPPHPRIIKSLNKDSLSNIPIQTLQQYLKFIESYRSKIQNQQWLSSVQEFYNLINTNTHLRMHWNIGTSKCANLFGKNLIEIINMIDTSCKMPPVYSFHCLIGFPINSIFVDFMQNQNGRMFFSNIEVNCILKKILNDHSRMLQSPKSKQFLIENSALGWFSQEANQKIQPHLFQCNTQQQFYGFDSWNSWFIRKFKQGKRPVGQGAHEGIAQHDIITNVCQCYPLETSKQPVFGVKQKDSFWLKDSLYSLYDMFGGEKFQGQKYSKIFSKGTIFQGFLSSLLYHRWHSPVEGTIQNIYKIDGTYYLDNSQFLQYDQESPFKSQIFLTAVATRMIIIIDSTNEKIGKIGLIFVGMAQVSSCISTVKIGQKLKKGDELGYFQFGGSSHVLIFEKKANLIFKQNLYKITQNNIYSSQKQNVCSYLAHII